MKTTLVDSWASKSSLCSIYLIGYLYLYSAGRGLSLLSDLLVERKEGLVPFVHRDSTMLSDTRTYRSFLSHLTTKQPKKNDPKKKKKKKNPDHVCSCSDLRLL
ncbi:hypothetical protein GE21DRAFT_1219373 [Neurospora crassa]|nr:hypothetical protein B1D4.20 [imported] - Neurospora crassa [Neurospora crassa]KHE80050.1 hypothetical protein GE21DRAFT_1219373 [Neurospora crassa]